MLRVKEPILILIFPLILALVGHCCIFWTAFEWGSRQNAVCVDLKGKMFVYCLKGKAEKTLSEGAKGHNFMEISSGRVFTLSVPVPERPCGWCHSLGITRLLALVIAADTGGGRSDF